MVDRDASESGHLGVEHRHTSEELKPVLAALRQWGDAHLPVPCGSTVLWRHRVSGEPVEVAFLDTHGQVVDRDNAVAERAPAHPA